MNGNRVAAGGRNWEAFGDPYLAGEASYQTIKATQATGVQANAKHYLANEQEHYRVSTGIRKEIKGKKIGEKRSEKKDLK